MKLDGLLSIPPALSLLAVNLATFTCLFAEVLILGTMICDLKLVREDVFLLFYPACLSTKLKHTLTALVFLSLECKPDEL